MDRRSFLLNTGTLALSQLVVGCGSSQEPTLRVQLLSNSIPTQLVSGFRHSLEQPVKLDFMPVEQLKDLFAELQSWSLQSTAKTNNGQWHLPLPWIKSHPTSATDLVTLGDYWLGAAIERGLIQPLAPAQMHQWHNLPMPWQQLVRRNTLGYPDPQGNVWAAPYSWGTTVIAYNRDKFKTLGWKPVDWSDLWRTELRGRISLLDQAREAIGLTLKKLGQSYNTQSVEKVPNLEKELVALNRQVKFYSSDNYLQPLILGDTWLAVGWSTDVLLAQKRYQQIEAVVPQSGTALWANLWVRPKGSDRPSLGEKWIDYCWQEKVARQISLLSKATSPIPVTLDPADIPTGARNLLLKQPNFERSEFLLPLPTATLNQYQALWQAMRHSIH